MEQPTVLIISDDAEFSRAVTGRWQMERSVPAFTLMTGDLWQGAEANAFELALVGTVRPPVLAASLAAFEATGKPVLFVAGDAQAAKRVREMHPRVMVLRQFEGWLDALILAGSESLRRSEAMARANTAEQANRSLQREAMLGRYILEQRHAVNNALTSVLGNSELLLAEPGSLSAGSRSQLDTIRHMSLRIHEILQRFSSLEKELNCGAKPLETEAGRVPRALAAGS